jgi:hypothetical protein
MDGSMLLFTANLSFVTGEFISDELAAAWRDDSSCAECGEPVHSVAEAALLVGSNRVTHRERCFVPALIRVHPQLKLLSARKGAEEGVTTSKEASNESAHRRGDAEQARSEGLHRG